ncbi:MAG: energy transducer TonB [Candidatus Aminicenantes bacterium]|nr:energy transducer TonB [Candidatus Aminicenantes bacterium]
MFNHSSMSSEKVRRPKSLTWLTLPLSLLFHVLLIASLVMVPLIRADANLPQFKVIRISTNPPPAPLVPSRGSGNDGRIKEGPGPKNPPKNPVQDGVLMVPMVVPETIEEENLDTIGVGNGDSDGVGGIPDGIIGGAPNALIGVQKGDKVDDSLPALRIASVQMPRKIREVKPVYSTIALAAHVQGKVVVEAMTDIYGRVRSARVIYSASPLLNESALSAIKQWLYEPYILNGIPKPVVFTVTITFTLEQ